MISKGIKTGLLQTAKAGLTPQPRRKAGRCGPLGGNCPERVGAISGLIAIGMLFVSTRGQVGAIENNQNPQWKSDAESTLLEIPLNGEWEYYPLGEDKPYEELPEGWEKTYVPVDQSKYNAFAKSPYVWFRRSFEIPEEWKGKKISLRFGGINSQADFWCNGELVDTHIVGWAPYRIDITRQMKIGESNLVSVKVARYAQIEGEKIDVYGYGESYGIYGGVKLEAHPLVYIDNLYIRTLVKESKIEIDVWIRNEDKKDQEVNLAAEIIDKTRIYPLVKNLASEEIKVGENSLKKFTLSSTWDNPHYWSLNDPYLYHLLVKIDSPEGIDQREVRFGFREFLAENGNFYLNGRKIRLRGDTFYVKPGWDNPAAIRGLLRFLKSHGSNSFRIWAMRGFSTLFKVADEEGILLDAVAAAGNPYAKGIRQDGWTKWEWDSESKFADVFDDVASRFIRCYWNHPSIVMWNLNNEYVIVKHGKRFDERMKALRRFIELHKKLDPYRPLTTDGDDAANDEPEMAVENIHDYSDVYDFWPITKFQRIDEKMVFDGKRERHYAGKKPLAFGEFHGRLPYFPAIYVGERQYRDPVYTGKFNGEYIKKLIEGWRIYGIDELHGCNDLYHRSFESRKLGYQKEGARLSWAYPDSPYSRGEAFSGFINLLYPDANEFELNELGKGYHASYRPVVVTCANQWDWAYFSGEEVEREIYVVNDNSGQRDMETEVIWELKEGAEIIKGGRDHLKVDPGANGVVKVKFGLPNVKERKELKWCLYLKEYEKVIDENAYDLEVFPLSYRDKPKIRSKIVLYDPEGESKKLLEQAGINYNEFKELKDFSGYDLLIIGEEAPRFEVEQARESIIDYVSKGGKVLIFKQRCALNITPAKMNVGTFQFNQTFPRAVEHPILKDLEENDFKMWRGYPHTVSVYPLHKPIFAANYKAMLHTGPNLDFTSLLEINHGEGLYLFSQLELSQRYGIDPVVTKLMNNIFEYLAGDRRIKWKIVGIYGGEQGILSRVIDKYKIIKDEDFSLKGIDILIIAPKAASIQTANHKEEIEEFVKGGGRVICLHQQETNFFSWLPKEVAIVNEVLDSKEVGAGVITFEDTESRIMNGISLFDLSPQYAPFPKWAKGYTGGAWTICSSPFIKDPLCQWDNGFKVLAGRHQKLQWWKATEIHNRAAILELNQGKGSYLMIQVPFEELLEKTQKARYVLSSMFTNMRIKLKQAPFITIRKDLISLDGNWLFKIDTGDIGLQQSWHKKDYDDTKWGIMGVPGPWETGIPLPDYDGYGWYRIHTLIPKEWEGKKIYLRVGRIDDCDWTYVNGHFAGSVTFTDAANGPYHNLTTPKGTNKKIEGGPYAVDREYEVPQEYIEFGKDNVIAVRVYDQKGHGGIFGGITDIRCEE